MFTVKIIRPDGQTQAFPLQIVKQSIMIDTSWEDCAGFLVPLEVDEFINDEFAGESIRYAFLEGGVTKGSFEDANDDEVHWELLLNGASCTHEEFSNSAWNNMKISYKIPRAIDHKYKGCGSGIAVIDKATNLVIDFEYTDENLHPLEDQNIEMCEDAGRIVAENENSITYRVNFSTYMIYLW